MRFQRSGLRHFGLAFTLAVASLITLSHVASAQSGTSNGQPAVAAGSQINSAGRTQPAPWRPNFGTIARQNDQTPAISTIPARQQATGQPGLPLPNSPVTGINLQNGTGSIVAPIQQPLVQPQVQPQVPPQAQPLNQQALGTLPSQFPAPATTTALPASGLNQTPNNQQADFQSVPIDSRRSITRVTKSMTQLPNDSGQVWREYDITPYTNAISGIDDPQQAILDWVLKETGTEMWFNQPLGILSADRNQIRVYHTPEIQDIVHGIIDRFVNTKGQVQNLEVSLITVNNPNWRSAAYPVLQPIEVQSPGVEAWMVTKENAALLRASLARRGDFKDHGTGRIAHNDGQTVVLKKTKPVQFIRNFRWVTGQIQSYQPLVTTVDEGYTLEISSLSSLDGNTVEATIHCHVDQVEKLDTVKVDVPGVVGATTDRVSLQIPQLVSWRLQERFRWRDDQVLLLSCGVVATPSSESASAINLPRVFGSSQKGRADALLFVDYRGPQLPGNVPQNSADSRTVPVSRR